jgi:hypothetical protein
MEPKLITVGTDPRIELAHVGGDLEVRSWDRPEVQLDGEDIHDLEQDGKSIRISCGSDLHLSVPRGARLGISFVGGDLDLQDVDGQIEIEFVGGDASLQNLKGEVSIEGVLGDLQMENVARVKVEPGKRGPGPDFSMGMSRKVEQATRRAQRKVEQAARQTQRKAEQTRQRVERELRGKLHGIPNGRNLNLNFDLGDFARGPRPEPVSDEERMTILRMLQEKKISSEEADKLLAALEGVG